MSYRIVIIESDQPQIALQGEPFATLEGALEYLQDQAEVGTEYEIVHIVKQLKYEMQRVLVPLEEKDTVSTYATSVPTFSEEEETLPFEVELNNS